MRKYNLANLLNKTKIDLSSLMISLETPDTMFLVDIMHFQYCIYCCSQSCYYQTKQLYRP